MYLPDNVLRLLQAMVSTLNMASDCVVAIDASTLPAFLHQSTIISRSCGILVKYYKKPLYTLISPPNKKRLFNPSLTVVPNPFLYPVKHLRQFMWHARISFTSSISYIPISNGYRHASTHEAMKSKIPSESGLMDLISCKVCSKYSDCRKSLRRNKKRKRK